MKRIYLDNAATSWPKPEAVYAAVDRYQRDCGASAGRGAYRSAQQAQRIVDETRLACAQLLGIPDSRQLVFTHNGTTALNMALHGLLRPGDHIVTTVCEHNSVLRPLQFLAERGALEVTHVECDSLGYVDAHAINEAISPKTRLVAITHASNVTGAIQPIAEITKLAHEAGALVLLDAAQTAGCVPVDVAQFDVDLLACGGHKGLLGPLGTGLLYVRSGLEDQMLAMHQGGTGTDSSSPQQPQSMPEKFESGNLNVPAIAGLGAAVRHLQEQTIEAVQLHHAQLTQQLWEGLSGIEGVTLYGPPPTQPRVAVVSCAVAGYDPQELAGVLDASCGIECRAGLHCAPLMHKALGTDQTAGLVRLSPGWAINADDIEQTIKAVAALAAPAT